MQTGSRRKPPGQPGCVAAKTVTVAFLVLGTFSSLYHTYVQQLLFCTMTPGRFHATPRWADSSGWRFAAGAVVGLRGAAAARSQNRSLGERSGRAAAGCPSVNLLFNLVGQVAPDLTLPWFTSTKFFVVLSLLDLAGVLMLLAAVLGFPDERSMAWRWHSWCWC